MRIEIMDTTLRDGEQTPGLAYKQHEKLTIAKILLEEVKVDRIEVASANVSKGELSSVQAITSMCAKWGCLEKVEVLGFVDKTRSVDWIVSSGAKVINLLCKGSLNHVTNQLRKTPEQHLEDIRFVIGYATQKNIKINVYLEDWSNGIISSPEYVFFLMDALKSENIMRFMLPDTLGILNASQSFELCRTMVEKYPGIKFDFHAHNDYDMAVANSFMALKAGFSGIHTAVNGLGERAGNTPLSSIIGVINDHLPEVETGVDESRLNSISKLIEAFSGIRIPVNKPIIGENVFTQTCGVHADGDNKGNLYYNKLVPERFGRLRKYALGKTSGKASILKNLEELGIFLENDAIARVTERIVELGDKKESITTEDLPFIVSDVLGNDILTEKVKLKNYYICHAQDLRPVATLKIEIDDVVYEETATGDGQYDAFMKALSKVYAHLGKPLPTLVDYIVTIPPGGKTNALVETVITWHKDKEFKTRGLDSDQTASSIKATVKMLNLIEID
ncbi:MAG: alpha-isopropylmalate synthase regulatory domain-containing protein [Bacillota bacterium]|nr:alpha-isopropylmalate synthase regulatory domain-containing protein [Bacillota bacterium]